MKTERQIMLELANELFNIHSSFGDMKNSIDNCYALENYIEYLKYLKSNEASTNRENELLNRIGL